MPETCRIEPLTAQRRPVFGELPGPRGGCGGRGFMHGKLPSKKFHALLHEGCPLEAVGESLPAFAAYTGLVPAFCQAGFIVVARYSKGRPIYRYWIGG